MSKILQNVMLGAGALLTIFAAYLVFGPDSRTTALLKRLETEGVVAQAKVISKHVEEYESYDSSGSRSGKRSLGRVIRDHNRRSENTTVNFLYYVDVEFKTAQGQVVRSKENILEEYFGGITVGAQVPILYHPEDPAEVSRLRDHASPYRDMSELLRIMAMFLLTVAGVLFWFGRPRGNKGETSGARDWEKAAGNRMASLRESRSAPPQARSDRGATLRPPSAKGFGRQRRGVGV